MSDDKANKNYESIIDKLADLHRKIGQSKEATDDAAIHLAISAMTIACACDKEGIIADLFLSYVKSRGKPEKKIKEICPIHGDLIRDIFTMSISNFHPMTALISIALSSALRAIELHDGTYLMALILFVNGNADKCKEVLTPVDGSLN